LIIFRITCDRLRLSGSKLHHWNERGPRHLYTQYPLSLTAFFRLFILQYFFAVYFHWTFTIMQLQITSVCSQIGAVDMVELWYCHIIFLISSFNKIILICANLIAYTAEDRLQTSVLWSWIIKDLMKIDNKEWISLMSIVKLQTR
jgi:hypothetical protein